MCLAPIVLKAGTSSFVLKYTKILCTKLIKGLNTFLSIGLYVLGWCINSFGFMTLPNNLFFTQIIKQSNNYVFSIIHDASQRSGRF
jgi:hypothetical protein